MTETGIVAMAGIITTLLSGIGSSVLTNRYAARRDRERLRFEVQIVLRQLIVSALVQSRQWTKAASAVAHAILREKDPDAQFQYLTKGRYESDDGKQFDKISTELRAILTEAQLLVADEQLISALDSIRSLQEGWVMPFVEPMPADFYRGLPEHSRRYLFWEEHHAAVASALRNLEVVSRAYISVNIK